MIISDANHVDLYDRPDKIPFDKMSEFFGTAMRATTDLRSRN
jgi:hypothetical protein